MASFDAEESPHTDQTDSKESYSDQTDEQFEEWVHQEMTCIAPELQPLYPAVFRQVAEAVRKWRQRYHGNVTLWNRLFKPSRVLKEVVEAVPVVQVVLDWFDKNPTCTDITILDLCSGKGFLSMLLSEILPTDRVEKCLLLDKAWPLCHSQPKPHHMSWDHIYTEDYFGSWPIPLITCKQDLKQSRTIQQLTDRLSSSDTDTTTTTVLILAVHLCGILSLQAIQLFRALPNAPLLLLKPCCLPDMSHTKRQDHFVVGNYCFPTADVCAAGKWTGSNRVWQGPPRWHLQPKFVKWCFYLQEAMDGDDKDADTTVVERMELPLQTKGGFQNCYLVVRRRRDSQEEYPTTN